MSKPFRYRWRDVRGFNFPALTMDDALTIKLAESALKTLMPVELLQGLGPRFQAATDRLAQMKGQTRNARWPNLVRAIPRTFELAPPRINAGILESVQEALLAGEQLDIEYQSLQDATFEARRISPHALLHKGQVTYLVATRDPEKGLRTYALHRMKSAKLTGLRVPRSDFDLDAYIASEAHEPGPNSPVTLEARVNANLAKILRETPLNPGMTMKRDGEGFRIKARGAREPGSLPLDPRPRQGHRNPPPDLPAQVDRRDRSRRRKPLRLIHDASCRIRQRTCRIDTFPEAPMPSRSLTRKQLSRSKIDLFLECPRCFFEDVARGNGRPSGPPFTLNNAVDALFKREFDDYRASAAAAPAVRHRRPGRSTVAGPAHRRLAHQFHGRSLARCRRPAGRSSAPWTISGSEPTAK